MMEDNGLIRLLAVTFALTVLTSSVRAGILYPRESETRQVTNLDGLWNFRSSNDTLQGFRERWYNDKLSKSGDTFEMPVPASYNDITEDISLREHVGTVWYDRTFFVPASWSSQSLRVWLRFGSVHYTAQVWINGKNVMYHEIGHLPFQSEITSVLKYGQENRITVAVDNVLSDTTVPQGTLSSVPTVNGTRTVLRYTFDFFNYAGIHRHVHLYTTPSMYIDDVTIYTDIAVNKGLIYYNVTTAGTLQYHHHHRRRGGRHNEDSGILKQDHRGDTGGQFNLDGDDNVTYRIDLLDADGKIVSTSLSGPTGLLEVNDVNLWWPYLMHPEPAYLYTLQIRISSNKYNQEDIYRMPVGIRTIHWSNTTLYINNQPVYLRGFGRHEDSDIRGKGLDMALVAKDYNLLKWVGANAYRTSHYPYAEEIMDMADKTGIMIIDECPSVDTDKFSAPLLNKHKDSLTQLIQRDKNRPSVIMWSVANEPRTQFKEADEYFRSIVDHVRKLDYRPITAAIAQSPGYEFLGQHLDIIGFNRYNGWYSDPGQTDVIQPNVEAEAELWHDKHNKPIIMMEYGADTMQGLHILPDYIWSEEYQVKLLSEHFKAFDNLRMKSFFIGEMIWNFADFKTDQSTTRVGGNKKGIFTRERQPKSAAHIVRARYHELANIIDGAPLPSGLNALFPYTSPYTTSSSLRYGGSSLSAYNNRIYQSDL